MRYSPLAFLLLACLTFGSFGCDNDAPPVPKPRSYPRVMYPERAYQPMSSDYCDFTFAAPVSAQMVREDFFFDEAPPDSCWFDLKLDPALNGQIHFSYYPVNSYEQWEQLRDQAFELVGVHNKRASDIEEIVIHRDDDDVHGIAFDIAGPAASPFQFFLTDTTNHFLRGALYFDTTIQPDSLAPIIDYVKEDIFTMVESFRWEAR